MADHHEALEPRLSGGPRPWTTPTLEQDYIARIGTAAAAGGAAPTEPASTPRERALAAGIIAEGCSYCEQHYPGMMPSHTASPRCESGKHPHCTCDTCF